MTNAEKELSKILTEQINREINNEIIRTLTNKKNSNNIIKGFDEYNYELERRPYKTKYKNKGIKIHKTPELSNTPKYIYAKYVMPLTGIKTVGNLAPVNLTVESSFYTTFSKITNEKDVIGL